MYFCNMPVNLRFSEVITLFFLHCLLLIFFFVKHAEIANGVHTPKVKKSFFLFVKQARPKISPNSFSGNITLLVITFIILVYRVCIVMYLSDIKSCVARTSIGAQFLSVGVQFLSVGAQDAPACYGLCEK